jgi:hypothetical protein
MTQDPTPTDPAPTPPRQPDDLDCCGSACGDACVWTIYRESMDQYEAALEAWQIRQLLKD